MFLSNFDGDLISDLRDTDSSSERYSESATQHLSSVRRHSMVLYSTLVCKPAHAHTHVLIKSTTRIATNDDSLVGSCASASSRRKFNADWP